MGAAKEDAVRGGQGYTLGIIGGSGLYEIAGLEQVSEVAVDTPYGAPSDRIVRGVLPTPHGETTLLFLPRHGRGHVYSPTNINYRANVCAMKLLGATHLVSISAVGSMREGIAPGDLVAVDQYIDATKHRTGTFFDEGLVAHVAFADPVCPLLTRAVADAAERALERSAGPGAASGANARPRRVHRSGTYLCMEGPQFSTRAESLLYRSFGVSVIGMTAMPEAKLAREAELPYATLALATDYDCWHESEAEVSVDAVLAVLRSNVDVARATIADLAATLPSPQASPASTALATAMMTAPERVSEATFDRLGWLVSKYLPRRV
jgi:5'-methylthioadenosine phosphorylase